MIDFQNALFVKLRAVHNEKYAQLLSPMLAGEERVVLSFQAVRDGVVFTDKRAIAINVRGVTGKQIDFTSLPYGKIQAYSVQTAGAMDPDCELEMYFAGLGVVRFEFESGTDIFEICRMISERAL